METKVATYTVNELIDDITTGEIRVPNFQRNFTWTKTQVIFLLDSILRGYPINTIVLWKSKQDVEYITSFYNHNYNYKQGNYNIILDGQQRSLSLFGCKKGIITDSFDFNNIVVSINDLLDLNTIPVFKYTNSSNENLISIVDILNKDMNDMTEKILSMSKDLSSNQVEVIIKMLLGIKSDILKYQLSVTETYGDNIIYAPKIFEKINMGGKKLTQENIIFAKLYLNDSKLDSEFDFEAYMGKVSTLISDFWGRDLPDEDIIRIITQSLTQETGVKNTNSANLDLVIENSDNLLRAINFTNRYLKDVFKLKSFSAIPKYKTLFSSMCIFYISNYMKEPNFTQKNKINKLILSFCLIQDNVDSQRISENTLFKQMSKISKGEELHKYIKFNPKLLLNKSLHTDTMKAIKILITLDTDYNYQRGYYLDLYDDNLQLDLVFLNSKTNLENILTLLNSGDPFVLDNSLQGISRNLIINNREEFQLKRLENLIDKLFLF